MKTVIACLAIATLSGMGLGSGGLLVTYLTLVETAPQLTAQGINLLFFLFASASSLLVHAGKRRMKLGAVAILALFGIAGSLWGGYVAARLPADLLGKLFGGMLTVTGILSLRRRPRSALRAKKQP